MESESLSDSPLLEREGCLLEGLGLTDRNDPGGVGELERFNGVTGLSLAFFPKDDKNTYM